MQAMAMAFGDSFCFASDFKGWAISHWPFAISPKLWGMINTIGIATPIVCVFPKAIAVFNPVRGGTMKAMAVGYGYGF